MLLQKSQIKSNCMKSKTTLKKIKLGKIFLYELERKSEKAKAETKQRKT